jgi:cytochrome P450
MAPFPFWQRLRDRGIEAHLEALHRAVAEFIAQARARLEANPPLRERPENLIEAMIAARDREGSGVDDSDVAGNVLTMLLAGEDTTANTLAWMIYLLARNPGHAKRAAEEVRRAAGGDFVLRSYEQVSGLAFVEACANETMRLKPVAPIIMAQALRDSVVAGVQVPAGALVMCLMRPAATDAQYFPSPADFDPARWLNETGQVKSAASAKRVAMPFGAGPRLCPGRYLAMLEIKMVIAMLFAGFDIERVSTPDGRDAEERLALTMAPVGLRALLRPRG